MKIKKTKTKIVRKKFFLVMENHNLKIIILNLGKQLKKIKIIYC